MLKRLQFFGKTDEGVFAQGLFSGALEKTAGAPPMADLKASPDLRQAVARISKQDRERFCYVLVNALGAGEYFGSNINADYFPWNALAHEGDDYGYKTFLRAHAFAHHKNKEPEHAFGIPIESLLNPRMKRVELIIQLDREKAKIEGADGVINRIDAGEFPDVSMGCKVPFDVCSICGNHSKTKDDYCEHMRPTPEQRERFGPNKILPDGRRICVINTLPRFFDISFVFIGADKTAKVMAKLAMVNGVWRPQSQFSELSADAGSRFYIDLGHTKTASITPPCPDRSCVECDRNCGGMGKLAGVFGKPKVAALKVAEKIKTVPGGSFAMKKLPEMERREPKLPKKAMEKISSVSLQTSLGALTAAGVVLHPDEFQELILTKMGEMDLLEDLQSSNSIFRETSSIQYVPFDVQGEATKVALAKVLPEIEEVLPQRTAFGEAFSIRSALPSDSSKKALPTQNPVEHSLLDKVSAAYNGYRRNVLMKLSEATEMVQSDPRLRAAVLGNGLVNMFSKQASTNPLLTLDSVAYLMGAHFSDRGRFNTTAVADAIAVGNHGLLEEEQ